MRLYGRQSNIVRMAYVLHYELLFLLFLLNPYIFNFHVSYSSLDHFL